MKRKVLLEEMTSEEAGKAIKEADFVILPAGSLEQHSLHL
ncbi:MAG: creatininase family protein, partial [Thermoproteota archaeon]